MLPTKNTQAKENSRGWNLRNPRERELQNWNLRKPPKTLENTHLRAEICGTHQNTQNNNHAAGIRNPAKQSNQRVSRPESEEAAKLLKSISQLQSEDLTKNTQAKKNLRSAILPGALLAACEPSRHPIAQHMGCAPRKRKLVVHPEK